jgi:iron complex outermembrane recepter protein
MKKTSKLKTGMLTRLLLSGAMVIPVGSNAIAQSQTEADEVENERAMDVVIVTANKREQTAQSVPASIAAVSGEQLQELSLAKLEDIALLAPSVSYKGQGRGGKAEFVMRGVSDGGDGNLGGAGPSSALYLDNQPVTTIRSNPDLHAYDLERIEVLNGPQGTLYGASSQSGTIKFITKAADPDAFDFGIDFGVGAIEDGGIDRSLEGFVNFPILDGKGALRLVGWTDQNGGYIDNTLTVRDYPRFRLISSEPTITNSNSEHVAEDFNTSSSSGFRAKFQYDFNDDWTMVLSGYYQDDEREGYWGRDPNKGDLETTVFTTPTGTSELQQYAFDLEGNLGFADLNLSIGHLERQVTEHRDFSVPASGLQALQTCANTRAGVFNGFNFLFNGSDCGDPGGYLFNNDIDEKRDTIEVRLTSSHDGPLQYVLGLYAEESSNDYQALGFSPGKLPQYDFSWHTPGAVFESLNSRVEKQQAVFGEVSYDWDALTFTVGARAFWAETDIDITTLPTWTFFTDRHDTGPFDTSFRSEENGKILTKFNVAYQINDSALLYATRSEGYRPGGPNRDENPNIPPTYDADILTAIELGYKSMWAGDKLKFNAALFEMSWDDFQSATFDLDLSPRGYTDNVGNARLRGAELDLTYRPSRKLKLDFALAKYEAEITEPFALTSSIATDKGSRLPRSPDFKASFRGNYYFPVTQDWRGYSRLLVTYNGEEAIELESIAGQEAEGGTTDPYTITNFTIGARRDNIRVEVYMKNVFDERTQNFISFNDFEFGYAPRSYGLNLSYRY